MYEQECEENALVRFPELVIVVNALQSNIDSLKKDIEDLKAMKSDKRTKGGD